jgi:hypothetical protein
MGSNVCKIIQAVKDVDRDPINLGDLPTEDLFKQTSLTVEDYNLLGSKNKLYSSEFLKNISQHIKKSKL